MQGASPRYCRECGYDHGGARFCPQCGTQQSRPSAPSESAEESHPADTYPGDYYSSGAANNMPNGDMSAQPESSSSGWYYSARGQRIGPLDREAVASQIFQGRITHDTLVWREGLPDWRRAAETELAGLLRGTSLGPPRLMGEAVNNGFVWIVAFLPYFVAFLPLFFAAFVNAFFCVIDAQQLKKAGHDTKGMGIMAALLVPVYLFVRASRLRQSPSYAVVWVINFILSLLFLPIA